MIYIGFSSICGFRHLPGVLECISRRYEATIVSHPQSFLQLPILLSPPAFSQCLCSYIFVQNLILFHNVKMPGPPKACLLPFLCTCQGGLTVCQALFFLLGITCVKITSSENSNEEEDDHHLWSGHEGPLLNTPCGLSHLLLATWYLRGRNCYYSHFADQKMRHREID